MEGNTIKRMSIHNLWSRYDFEWNEIHQDVNILVGVNGSGKSTFISVVKAFLENNSSYFKDIELESATLELQRTCLHYENDQITVEGDPHIPYLSIGTWDIPILYQRALRVGEKPLDAELDATLYQREGNRFSFTDYRLQALNNPEQQAIINEQITRFFDHINHLFENTGKKIEINPQNNCLQFNQQGRIIQLNYLSSGEKQLLIILFKILLMQQKAQIILLDEPEVSMHIEWQYRLIDEIKSINPNAQLIISSHSPSIFGNGWGDKLIYLEDLLVNR